MRRLVRTLAYPFVFGSCALLLLTFASQSIAYWPAFPLVVGKPR